MDIAFDASETDVKTALLGLTAITDVAVTKSAAANIYGGYTWAVEFLEINTLNAYGIIADSMGNLKPLTPVLIDDSTGNVLLIGTDATVNVAYDGQEEPDDDVLSTGTAGSNAGTAYVYIKSGEQWLPQETGKLMSSDLQGGDQFGFSVDIDADRSIVGAPYAVRKMKNIKFIF